MHLFLKFLLLVLASFSVPTLASQWTDSEIKAMPPYCAARLYIDPGSVEYWKGILGPDYLHTHHLCYALGAISRYYRARTYTDKMGNLQSAINDLNYVLGHASPGYILMPDVYMNRGLALSLMKKDASAITDFLKAVEMNPKLTRAYTMVADHYVKLKKQDEALKLVTEGLRHNPESKVLQRQYKKLGGQLPYPEPIAQQAKAPETATKIEGTSPAGDKADKETVPEVQAPASTKNEAAKNDSDQAVAETSPPPKIGSPSNPWCRFCPAEPGQ